MNYLDLLITIGFVVKLTLTCIASARGWKGYPWLVWPVSEVVFGIALGVLVGFNFVTEWVCAAIIPVIGLATLFMLIYMIIYPRKKVKVVA